MKGDGDMRMGMGAGLRMRAGPSGGSVTEEFCEVCVMDRGECDVKAPGGIENSDGALCGGGALDADSSVS